MKQALTVSYKEDLLKRLKSDAEYRAMYLTEVVRDRDSKALLVALRNIAEAVGGIGRLAEETGMNRQGLYRLLSKDGNPRLLSFEKILDAFGVEMSFRPCKRELAEARR
jgi:probable addiction module antidote protein